LGTVDPEMFRPVGAALGAARVIRWNHALARRGRCLLPVDLLAESGLSVHAASAAPESPEVTAVLLRVAAEGQGFLAQAPTRRLPRAVVAAALPAVLAKRDLRRGPAAHPGPRGLGDRVAVFWAAIVGRV
jgi:15-cis-phytoene synthase